jgi:hypothetical protein
MQGELSRAMEPLTPKEKAWFGEHSRITPVSHTYIGGHLKSWNDMWLNFWDTAEIEWQNLDEFMQQPDWEMPLWQIPVNRNNPYTEEKVRPLAPYDEAEKVQNPCAVINTDNFSENDGNTSAEKLPRDRIVVFHNGEGPMCLEFLEFIETLEYPVEQHLTGDKDFSETFLAYKNMISETEGLSPSFGYYPIIYVNDRVFSGFDKHIKNEILKEIE